MPTNDSEICSFMSLAQCDHRTAEKYLKKSHWNMNSALNSYYDSVMGNHINGHSSHKKEDYSIELFNLYDKYAADEGSVIDSEGLIRLIEDLGYSLDELVTICLSKLLNCSNISNGVTRENFLSGCYGEGCSSLAQIRHILEDLDYKLENNIDYFIEIYKYTFELVIDLNNRHLDLDTAIEYWNLFFQPKYPIHTEEKLLSLWIKFLRDENKPAISRDSWQMLIEFFRRFPTIKAIKSSYTETDPWPYIIDEFYEYLLDNNVI